jgi:hypothetical protein
MRMQVSKSGLQILTLCTTGCKTTDAINEMADQIEDVTRDVTGGDLDIEDVD